MWPEAVKRSRKCSEKTLEGQGKAVERQWKGQGKAVEMPRESRLEGTVAASTSMPNAASSMTVSLCSACFSTRVASAMSDSATAHRSSSPYDPESSDTPADAWTVCDKRNGRVSEKKRQRFRDRRPAVFQREKKGSAF